MNQQNNKPKSKFFNDELFKDVNINDIGSSTSNQVISWGVGGNRNRNSNNKPIDNMNEFGSGSSVNSINDNQSTSDFISHLVNDDNKSTPVLKPHIDEAIFQSQNQANFSKPMFKDNMNVQVTSGFEQFNCPVTPSDDAVNMFKNYAMPTVQKGKVSSEFVQNNPVFHGYNANNDVVQQQMPVQQQMIQQPVQQVQIQQTQTIQQQPIVQQPVQQVPVQQPMVQQSVIQQPVQQQVSVQPMPAILPNLAAPAPVAPQKPVESQEVAKPLKYQPPEEKKVEPKQVIPDKDYVPLNVSASDGQINQELMSNQPLSIMALSGEAIDEEAKPKDVLVNNKYFQDTKLNDNRVKAEDIVSVVIPPKDPLAEPTRNIDMKALIVAYVGPKYQAISMSPFSFCGALFGSSYFFYRKSYLMGLIVAVVNILIIIFSLFNLKIGFIVGLVFFVVLGLFTNPLYLSSVEKKVTKIAFDNPKAKQHELVKICTSSGGTSIAMMIVFMIITSFITLFITIIFGGAALISKLTNQSGGTLKQDVNYKVEDLITYKLDPAFILDEETGNYIYTPKDPDKGFDIVWSRCQFSIGTVSGYETSKDLITHMAESDRRYNKIGTYLDAKGTLYDTYEFDDRSGRVIYRARKVKDSMILISYYIGKKSGDGVCDTYLVDMINSIQEK